MQSTVWYVFITIHYKSIIMWPNNMSVWIQWTHQTYSFSQMKKYLSSHSRSAHLPWTWYMEAIHSSPLPQLLGSPSAQWNLSIIALSLIHLYRPSTSMSLPPSQHVRSVIFNNNSNNKWKCAQHFQSKNTFAFCKVFHELVPFLLS